MPDSLSNRGHTLADRIRDIADRADVPHPNYRALALDLWALRVEASREADTLDAQMTDMACAFKGDPINV